MQEFMVKILLRRMRHDAFFLFTPQHCNFYELSMNNLYDSVNANENLKADCESNMLYHTNRLMQDQLKT